MTPYYADPWLTVYEGDCRAVLADLPAESVHTVVTSPPYWGLRDYGNAGQLGLEPTPEEYVANMVAVFREVRRVLRDDGTLWLNLGDSYTSIGRSARRESPGVGAKQEMQRVEREVRWQAGGGHNFSWTLPGGQKPKDLVGIPWRVAFALQADGWYLRSDIIWSKPNPMPESVTDRPTKAHEYLFLLSKSPRYYYDADAVREATEPWAANHPDSWATGMEGGHDVIRWSQRAPGAATAGTGDMRSGRNLRSVWTVATQPYPGAHFATFPPKLIEPAIKAGTSERGVCPECGAPWERIVDGTKYTPPIVAPGVRFVDESRGDKTRKLSGAAYNEQVQRFTTGWRPSCWHQRPELEPGTAPTDPAVVLDPFAGSGTTGMVAQSLSRRAVLIDLNGEYLTQAMARNRDIPLGLDVA